MSRSTKSNIRSVIPPTETPHVMTPEQLARRFERFERQIGIPGLVEIGRYRYASAYEGLRRMVERGYLAYHPANPGRDA